MANRKGIKAVKKNSDEIRNEIKEYHRKKWKRRFVIFCLLLVLAVLIAIFMAVRSFSNFSVSESKTQGDSSASAFTEFNGKILEYSNDGILCTDKSGTLIWNESLEMNTPKLDICGSYAVIYDKGGTQVCILNDSGIVESISVQHLITKVSVASQGTVAVMSGEDNDTFIELYDRNGTKLTSGEYHEAQNIIPIDIALSDDAQNMAVDSLDMSAKTVNTVIDFYNFGSEGQEKENNRVASYSYENVLVPEIDYISSKTMIAVADQQIMIFDGTAAPKEKRVISFDEEASAVFHNDKYIGIAYPNEGDDVTFHIKVYNLNGKTVMENETSILFDSIRLLSNNEICVIGSNEVDLYTIHSIRKFNYEFDTELYAFFPIDGLDNYLVIRKGETERIHLKL